MVWWAASAASSANSMSLMSTSRTLVFAFSWDRLNNFPSDLVWRLDSVS